MKLFWSIIVIFLFAAAGMAWLQVRTDGGSGAWQSSAAPSEAPQRDPVVASRGERVRQAESAPSPSDSLATTGSASPPESATEDELAKELVDDLLASSTEDAVEVPPGPPSPAAGHEHQQVRSSENPWAAADGAAGGGAAETGQTEPLEHSIVPNDDGSKLVDGAFTLRGEGTAEQPYEVTWDLLMSAAETYQPRLGMKELPERIKMLDGAHIKIAGYLMFPMASFEANEALVMLNMWDGCCIGVMPSPYDAIEVQLSESVPASTRQTFNYGTVEGRLLVDPYLVSEWLVGLYVLEDARLNIGM